MKTQEAHDIVNKEINVILKEIEKIKIEGCDECMFSYGKWVLCETCKSKLEYKISKLKGIISQEATEIEDRKKYPLLLFEHGRFRLQALKISMADLQEKIK